MKYLQSQASQYVHGKRETNNPTMAARFAMGGGYRQAIVRYKRRRKSAYPRNPAPAAVVAIAGKIPGLGNILKTPSEKQAAKVAPALIASAVNGNLTAAKAIEARTAIGIAKERAVWAAAWAQVPKRIRDLLKKYGDQVPGVDHSKPAIAAQEALTRAVDANELEEQAEEEVRQLRAERAAGARETAAARERREARLTELGAAGLQALARGGRRPRARRRSRRRSRSIDLGF